MPVKRRVFLDASVLIAGTLSATGASRVVIELAETGHLRPILSERVVREARLNLLRKAKRSSLVELSRLLRPLHLAIHPTPTERAQNRYSQLIEDPDDRHVLAAAARYRAHALLTLDRRHFMTERLRQARLPFAIQTPGDFLADYRASL